MLTEESRYEREGVFRTSADSLGIGKITPFSFVLSADEDFDAIALPCVEGEAARSEAFCACVTEEREQHDKNA